MHSDMNTVPSCFLITFPQRHAEGGRERGGERERESERERGGGRERSLS